MAVSNVQTPSDYWMERLSWAALGLGVLIRIVLWLQDRSLFIDEANLLRNLVERPYGGFFQRLDYHQYAPPLFCMIEKGFLDLFGVSGRAGRLLPLLAGLGSLFLFRRVAVRFLAPAPAAFGLLFLAIGEPFFRYATELKQYSTDLLTSLMLVSLVLYPASALPDTRRWWLLGLSGVLAVWWSMPSVFVLSGIGVYLLVVTARTGSRRKLFPLACTGMAWVLSFACYYFLLLGPDSEAPGLQQAHEFLRIQELLRQLRSLGKTAVGYVFFSDVVFWSGLVGGIYALLRGHKPEGLLVVVPMLCCLLASGLGFYPVTERLTLFFMPLLIIFLGMGWEVLLQWQRRWIKPLLLGAVLLASFSRAPLRYFYRPYEVVAVREALAYIRSEAGSVDQVYANPDTGPSTYYYTHQEQWALSVHISEGNAVEELRRLHDAYPGSPVWILWNASEDFPYVQLLPGREMERKIDFAGCRVYRFTAVR